MKTILIVVTAAAAIFLLLKLVSLWDSSRGTVDPETVRPAVPPHETQTQAPDISVREPTEEEREGLADGSLTKEDLVQDLVDDAVVQPPSDPETPPPDQDTPAEQPAPPSQPVQTEYERRLAELIAEAYVLREEYIVTLDRLYAEAETALAACMEQENAEDETASLVSSYLTTATELELQCDGQIDTIVAEMETLIRDNHGDMRLVDSLVETYVTEKAAKKAWYLERLEEKGLISS